MQTIDRRNCVIDVDGSLSVLFCRTCVRCRGTFAIDTERQDEPTVCPPCWAPSCFRTIADHPPYRLSDDLPRLLPIDSWTAAYVVGLPIRDPLHFWRLWRAT